MMRRLFSSYLIASGVAVHAALLALIGFWLLGKVASTGVVIDLKRAMYGALDGVEVTEVRPVASGALNNDLLRLPIGRWHKIHTTTDFERQMHGGAAFDAMRGRLMLFGSDTHSKNWDNTVRFFDVAALRWSQSYQEDSPSSYRVNGEGLPVAGSAGDRPWAMHTFDAIEYDPVADQLIVASFPKHMAPTKSWGMSKAMWRQIKRHPTWVYSVADNSWTPLGGKPVHFFPHATAFDSTRNVVIGVKPGGYYELRGDPPVWRRVAKGAPHGYHSAAAYDSDRDIVVSFGLSKPSNVVWQYQRGDELARKMPTPGQRPPKDQSVPLVYHPGVQRIVALVVNRKSKITETWLYATIDDTWTRIHTADVPFDVGMNYDMVYDSRHDILLLVANMRGDPVSVWALRLQA